MTAAPTPTRRRRFAPVAWLGGAAAALLLVLGVNGTLASWTEAVITNNSNTAGATMAVALMESGPKTDGTTIECNTVEEATNAIAACAINKYGGDLAMKPGDSKVVNVTFTNTGSGAASTFQLAPGLCTDNNSGTLCSNGHLTTAVSCSDGATYNSSSAYTDLVWAAAAPNSQTSKTHSATIAAGAKITCQFTTTLKADAPASVANTSISQPLTWTLSA